MLDFDVLEDDVLSEMKFDMHVHTTASDGIFSPTEIVEMAADIGLDGLAITDHDTIDGVAEAKLAADKLGLKLVAGIELSCDVISIKGVIHEIHILGYFLDVENVEFLAKLKELQNDRIERVTKILAKLEDLDMPLPADFLAEFPDTSSIGRPAIARKMVELGYVYTVKDAFDYWLGDNMPAYVPRTKLVPEEAIDLIHKAGGVAVMAHPGQADYDGFIPVYKQAGLDGLECYHKSHHPKIIKHYLAVARRLDLVATGGSDCHDEGLGCHYIGGENVQILAGLAKLRK